MAVQACLKTETIVKATQTECAAKQKHEIRERLGFTKPHMLATLEVANQLPLEERTSHRTIDYFSFWELCKDEFNNKELADIKRSKFTTLTSGDFNAMLRLTMAVFPDVLKWDHFEVQSVRFDEEQYDADECRTTQPVLFNHRGEKGKDHETSFYHSRAGISGADLRDWLNASGPCCHSGHH